MSRLNSSNIRNLLSLLRKAARQAKESLEDIADSIPRNFSPRPSLVRVPVDSRRRLRNRYCNNPRFDPIRQFYFHRQHGFGCRFFSSGNYGSMKLPPAVLRATVNPMVTTHASNIIARSIHCSSAVSTLKKSRPLILYKYFGLETPFRNSVETSLLYRAQCLGNRSFHSYRKFPKPSQAMKSIWESQVKSYKQFKHARPSTFSNQFLFPRPTTSSVILSSLQRRSSSTSSTSSIPSLSELARAFHSQVPKTGSYVDFELTPHITVPSVTELTSEVVDQISDDLERFAEELKRISKDLRRVATLGELPLSVEHGKALRVYFANCEPERVHSLLAGAEVTQGVVRSQSYSPILSPIEDFSDSSSFYMSSSGSDNISSTSADEFHYLRESSDSDRFDIANIRGIQSSEGSFVSVTTPSLTNSPSNETISEGSSLLI